MGCVPWVIMGWLNYLYSVLNERKKVGSHPFVCSPPTCGVQDLYNKSRSVNLILALIGTI